MPDTGDGEGIVGIDDRERGTHQRANGSPGRRGLWRVAAAALVVGVCGVVGAGTASQQALAKKAPG